MAKTRLKVVKLRPEKIKQSSKEVLKHAATLPLDETIVLGYALNGDFFIRNNMMSRERFNMMLDQAKIINLRETITGAVQNG